MNQVSDILSLLAHAQQQNIDAVLVTVVRTEGSAYRHAGAMMLICEDGRSVGMISGGCLEPHIIKRAFWLTRHGASVQTYQTGDEIWGNDNDDNRDNRSNDAGSTIDEGLIVENKSRAKDRLSDIDLDSDRYDEIDGELNFGLGCNGRVHVLFERLATAISLLQLIGQVRTTQQPVTIATLVKYDSTQCQTAQNRDQQYQIGTRINLDAYLNTGQLAVVDTNVSNDINVTNQIVPDTSTTLTQAAQQLSGHTFHKKNAEYVIVKSDLGERLIDANKHKTEQTEWLVQRIFPQIRLLICGAGNDVIPLVTMAKLQDWHVTVIDSRPQYATFARFKQADEVMYLPLEDTDTLIKLSSNALVALMSHSLTQDRARLAVLLIHSAQCNYKYLGQLGPRYRTERLINEISTTTANPAVLAAGIAKLHYPIGYKLGGDGPEALALSIIAQMSAVVNGQLPEVASQQAAIEQATVQPVVACDNVANLIADNGSNPPSDHMHSNVPTHIFSHVSNSVPSYKNDYAHD